MKFRRLFIFLFSLAGIGSLSLSVAPVTAAGLSYREILHFYMQDGKPQINQPAPDISDPSGAREIPVSLDFSADGKTLAVGYDGSVRFWDVASGSLQSERHFEKQINSYLYAGTQVRYSPDGRLLAVAANDEIKIYAGETQVYRCVDYSDSLFSWSPDGKFIAGARKDGHMGICNIQSGLSRIFEGLYSTATEWSPDGKFIAALTITHDYIDYLRVFNVETERIEYSVNGTASVAWRPDGEELVSPMFLADVIRFRDSQWARSRLDIPARSTSDVAWHPGAKRIASLSYQDNIRVWDVNTGAKLAEIPVIMRYIPRLSRSRWRMVWNRTGSQLAAIDALNVVHIWEESGEQPASSLATTTPRQSYNANQATWTPNPKLVKPIYPQTWKVITKQSGVKSLQGLIYDSYRSTSYSNNAYTLDFDTAKSAWVLYRRGNAVQTRLILSRVSNDIKHAAWSADGRYLAYSQDLANIHILDLRTYQIIRTIRHRDTVIQVVWHPSEAIMFSFSQDVTGGTQSLLIIYDDRTHKTISLPQSEMVFSSHGFAWAGKTEMITSWGYGIRFWNLKGNIETFLAPEHLISGQASFDSRYLAYIDNGSGKSALNLLDMETRSVVRQFTGIGDIYDFGWSLDGQRLLILDKQNNLTIFGN